jgi:pimeloyl-ACP methyl ester carboxylesterase
MASCSSISRQFEDLPPRRFRFIKWLPYIPRSMLAIPLLMLAKPIRRSRLGQAAVMSHDPDPAVRRSYQRPRLRPAIGRDTANVQRAIATDVTLAAAGTFPAREQAVLVAWADDDRLFESSIPRRLVDAFPNATLETIPNSRTFIPEDAPAALADAILRFLAAHPLGAGADTARAAA